MGELQGLSVEAKYNTAFLLEDAALTQAVFEFLDVLKNPDTVSMFDLAPFVEDKFSMTEQTAKRFISLWLRSFSQRFMNKEIKTTISA